jgi:hypothetical protein
MVGGKISTTPVVASQGLDIMCLSTARRVQCQLEHRSLEGEQNRCLPTVGFWQYLSTADIVGRRYRAERPVIVFTEGQACFG